VKFYSRPARRNVFYFQCEYRLAFISFHPWCFSSEITRLIISSNFSGFIHYTIQPLHDNSYLYRCKLLSLLCAATATSIFRAVLLTKLHQMLNRNNFKNRQNCNCSTERIGNHLGLRYGNRTHGEREAE